METGQDFGGLPSSAQGLLSAGAPTATAGPVPTTPLLSSSPKPASSLVIQWLQENYESEEGSSLPRSTLYTHYLQFCAQTNLESINAASFGKLIRSVFPHLKTRRLGTRGHSKYHYYGIRLKPSSKLRVSSLPPKSKPPKKRDLHSTGPPPFGTPKHTIEPGGPLSPSTLNIGAVPGGPEGPAVSGGGGMVGSKQLPDFGMPERSKLPPSLRLEQVQTFMLMYRTHCQRLLDTTAWHSFADVEKLLRHFWQGMPPHFRPIIQAEAVIDIIVDRDLLVYQTIIEQLLPDVLAVLPLSLSQAIREFSRQFVQWLSFAMESLPSSLVERKLLVATDFAHTLRKQACLNHIAQSCRKVLQSPQHVSAMLVDWSRIDFPAIAEQTAWLCHSSEDTTQTIQDDFKQFLQQRFGVEQWAQWLSDIVNRFLVKCGDLRQLTLTSQQLLLKWSFYSSLIIRDLTIRNAPSLGSFHLLRTLFDSYMAYLVEQRLASHEIRMTYVGDSTHSTSQGALPPSLSSGFPPVHHEMGEGTAGGPGGTQLEGMFPKYQQVHSHHEVPGVVAPTQNRSTGKHYMPFLPPEGIERPTKQMRIDLQQAAPQQPQISSQSQSHIQQLPSASNPSSQPPSISSALLSPQPSDLMKPPHPPPLPSHPSNYPPLSDRMSFLGSGMIQTAGGYVLPKTTTLGAAPPVGSFPPGPGGDYNGLGSVNSAMNSVGRKPSFGSFGSFSSEFSRSLFRSSFDRSRASFDRREGSIDQGESSPWQHLFYTLSTPHVSFQSFSLDHGDENSHPQPAGPPSVPKDSSAPTTTNTNGAPTSVQANTPIPPAPVEGGAPASEKY